VASDEARDPRPPHQTQSRALRREPVRGDRGPRRAHETHRPTFIGPEPRLQTLQEVKRTRQTRNLALRREPVRGNRGPRRAHETHRPTRALGRGTLPAETWGEVVPWTQTGTRDSTGALALRREPVSRDRGPRRAHETYRPTHALGRGPDPSEARVVDRGPIRAHGTTNRTHTHPHAHLHAQTRTPARKNRKRRIKYPTGPRQNYSPLASGPFGRLAVAHRQALLL